MSPDTDAVRHFHVDACTEPQDTTRHGHIVDAGAQPEQLRRHRDVHHDRMRQAMRRAQHQLLCASLYTAFKRTCGGSKTADTENGNQADGQASQSSANDLRGGIDSVAAI